MTGLSAIFADFHDTFLKTQIKHNCCPIDRLATCPLLYYTFDKLPLETLTTLTHNIPRPNLALTISDMRSVFACTWMVSS